MSGGSKVQVTFQRSRVQVAAPLINYQTTQIPLDLMKHFLKRLEEEARRHLTLFIDLYLGDLYCVSKLSLNKHLANGHLELYPAYRYSLYGTLHNREICQRRTLRARPKGVCLRESLLWLLCQVVC